MTIFFLKSIRNAQRECMISASFGGRLLNEALGKDVELRLRRRGGRRRARPKSVDVTREAGKNVLPSARRVSFGIGSRLHNPTTERRTRKKFHLENVEPKCAFFPITRVGSWLSNDPAWRRWRALLGDDLGVGRSVGVWLRLVKERRGVRIVALDWSCHLKVRLEVRSCSVLLRGKENKKCNIGAMKAFSAKTVKKERIPRSWQSSGWFTRSFIEFSGLCIGGRGAALPNQHDFHPTCVSFRAKLGITYATW